MAGHYLARGMAIQQSSEFLYLGVVVILVVLMILALVVFWVSEKKRKEKTERMKENLMPLFDKERALIKAYSIEIGSSQEYRGLVKSILLHDPFAGLVMNAKKKAPEENVREWFEKNYKQSLLSLLREFNPNFRMVDASILVHLLDIYVSVAVELIEGG